MQNVLRNNRISKFKNGAILTVTPRAPLPCLNGDPDLKRYDVESEKTLTANTPVTLRLDDAPDPKVDRWIQHPVDKTQKLHLQSFTADEEFLVTLCELSEDRLSVIKVYKQWTWTLHYEALPTPTQRLARGNIVRGIDLIVPDKGPMAKWHDAPLIGGRRNMQILGRTATQGTKDELVKAPEGWIRSSTTLQ